MKFVPSEFSNSAWDIFILSKEIAQNNFQQNIDSENILLALIKQDIFTSKILKKNYVNMKIFIHHHQFEEQGRTTLGFYI